MMKKTKRQACMLLTAVCLGVSGATGIASTPAAAEEITVPDSFIPVPADDSQIAAIGASGLQAMVHLRDAQGNWSTQITDITKERIHDALMLDKDHQSAMISVFDSCLPEGYISYTGIYNGDPAAAPSNGQFNIGSMDGKDRIGGQDTAFLTKKEDGSWSYQEGRQYLDVWGTVPVPAADLAQVEVTFRSVSTGKMYSIGLIDNTFTQTYFDESELSSEETRLNLVIKLDEYQKRLAELTGSVIEFGGIVPEATAGAQYKDRRRIEVLLTAQGWKLKDRGYDVEGYPVLDHLGIDFLETSASRQPVSMYRLYNPNSGEHFYTASDNEKAYLVKAGWKDEGEGWKAPEISSKPVYRLYNENAGDHHYTLNVKEKNALISYGWKDEGIGWYSDDAESVPLYRQYNPNAKAGSHNYTTSLNEHQFLTSNGWNDEGIAWYGVKND